MLSSNIGISIIVVTYNPGAQIINCLTSIFNNKIFIKDVYVIDNNSTDNSLKNVKKMFPMVKYIELKRNVGYGCAINIASKFLTNSDLMLITNQDVILENNCIEKLIEAYFKYGEGIYQPMILLGDHKRINTAGNEISLSGFSLLSNYGNYFDLFYSISPAIKKITYASGAIFLIPKKIFRDVGCFDSYYFMYKEDLDLGWRSLLMGYTSFLVPSAVVFHSYIPLTKNISSKIYFSERNRILVMLKNYQCRTLLILLPYIILNELFILGFFMLSGNLGIKLRSYVDIIKSIPYVMQKRKWIQNNRRLHDKDILFRFSTKFIGDHFLGSSGYFISISNAINIFMSGIGKFLMSLVK
ncbi:MAG: glycosyltransferase family 2 protein [Candidatus Helarchaeota archaeon]